MTPEVKAARAAKIGAFSKKLWASLTGEQRTSKILKMVKNLPRSAISDAFRGALQDAGLYTGFQSELGISGFVVDEVHTEKKLIVEFYGDYFHCNPRKYTDPDWFNPTLKMTAGQKWQYDRRRLACFLRLGYRVLVVWESDWAANPQGVLAKVRLFLAPVPDPKFHESAPSARIG
jgi:very-short-patch-repair endonuclease